MTVVSIILPAFNVAPYVENSIRSALIQTLKDIEIIVVDDASSDTTRPIVERLASQDRRIRPILLDRNVGVCAARNHALDAASGTWIAILDADDWMSSTRLARMVEAARRLDADWIADDQCFVREDDRGKAAYLLVNEPEGERLIDPAHIIERDPPDHLGYGLLKPLIRRAFLDHHAIRYRTGFERFEDFLLNMDCATAGARMALINEAHYFYLLRRGSMTSMDPIRTLQGLLHANSMARDAAIRAAMDALSGALDDRGRLINRDLIYHAFVQPLKQWKLGAAARALAQNPTLVPYLARKLASRAAVRVTRKDPLSLVLLPRQRQRQRR